MRNFDIKTYSISDYLLVSKILEKNELSWRDSLFILSTRITNHLSRIREIIGTPECLLNIKNPTAGSFFDSYKINDKYKDALEDLKLQYESNERFMKRFNKRMEKVRGH